MRVHTSAFVAVVALLSAGCSDATTGPEPEGLFAVLPAYAGFDFDVSVTPQRMHVGDTAIVTATVTNRTPFPKRLTFGGCRFWVEAEGPNGERIPQEGGGLFCAAVMSEVTLAPGESMRTQSRWTHTERHYPPLHFTYQPPGTVRFRPVLGVRLATGVGRRARETATLVVD